MSTDPEFIFDRFRSEGEPPFSVPYRDGWEYVAIPIDHELPDQIDTRERRDEG